MCDAKGKIAIGRALNISQDEGHGCYARFFTKINYRYGYQGKKKR